LIANDSTDLLSLIAVLAGGRHGQPDHPKTRRRIKSYLRLRSAKNGRSVEEEVRVILGELIQGRPELPVRASPASTEASISAPQPVGTAIGQASVTLIIGGGIAAFKSLELIRRLKERHIDVRCVLTKAHSNSSRRFPPARCRMSASIRTCSTPQRIRRRSYPPCARMRSDRGGAGDRRPDGEDGARATPTISPARSCSAADRPILLAPAMNPLMWNNAATRRNVLQLRRDGINMIGPNAGEMAESTRPASADVGGGRNRRRRRRHSAPAATASARRKARADHAGPTHEPIDPVRYIANRSSGKQGFAIAAAAQAAGADVTLVSGPVELRDPPGVTVIRVESARDMLHRVEAALPADIAIFAAAVADWRVANEGEQKLKKTAAGHAAAATGGKPRHSRNDLEAAGQAAAAGDRVCRRDRASDRQRQGQDRAQGLRLDRRQRRFARNRRDGRRPQHGSPVDARRRQRDRG
jgi:phosphopantothenoylcysteine decarboxylase/phosphopantothenate--cysteine ligase